MKKIFFTLTFFLLVSGAWAQSFSITGTVVDGLDNSPVPGAVAQLIRLPDSTRTATPTEANGSFAFRSVSPGRYSLQVSFLGYATFIRSVGVRDQHIELGQIRMNVGTSQLREVVVTGQMAAAEQKGDTTQFNAGAFKTHQNANAEELVQKLPGVTMENGQVQAQGENVSRVLVDGKVFFGDDATAALRNLPAEIIDKIQVFDRRSDMSEMSGIDDGERMKTINIVTRQDMRDGKFGRVYGGYGTDDRYMAGGNANYFNGSSRISILGQTNNINQQNFASEDFLGVAAGATGGRGGGGGGPRGGGGGGGPRGGGGGGGGPRGGGGGGGNNAGDFLVGRQGGISATDALGVNYSDSWGEKINITGSYFFNRTNNVAYTRLNQLQLLASNQEQLRAEENRSNSQNGNHRLNFRIQYQINPRNSLMITPRLSAQDNSGFSRVTSNTIRGAMPVNEVENQLRTALQGTNFNNNILYTHRFEKRGRTFSVNLGTGFNNRDGENFLLSLNRSFTGQGLTERTDQNSLLESKGWNVSGDVTYNEPVSEKSSLTMNYRVAYQFSDSDRQTLAREEITQQYSLLDPTLTNVFTSGYLTQSIGPGYRYMTPKLQVNTQLDYQTATLDQEQLFPDNYEFARKFTNVLPRASLRFRLSPQKDFSINYRSNTNPPSVEQMQDVINPTNPLQLTVGNPDLVQNYQHRVFARFSRTIPEKSSVFFAGFFANMTNNAITNSIFTAEDDTPISPTITLPAGGQLIRPVNLDGNYSLRAFTSYGFPLTVIRSKVNLNLSSGITRNPGLVNNQLNYTNNTLFNGGVVLSSNISQNLDFTLSSQSTYNLARNTLREQLNTNFFSQNSFARVVWVFWKGLMVETDLNHQLNQGLTQGFNQNFLLWNASFGKKVFKNQRGEIKVTAFDLLKQNNSISRNIMDGFIEDVETQVLQRYFMLNFNYNFRHFATKPEGSR